MSSVDKGRGFTARDKPVMGSRRKQSRPVAAAASPFASASEAAGSNPVAPIDGAPAPAPMEEGSPVPPLSPIINEVPYYDFPVVYFFITYADLQSSPRLNTYINMQTNACNQHATSAGLANMPTQAAASSHPFLLSDSEICILFMYWDAAHHAALHTASFNDVTFLNDHVLGHAKIKHHPPYLAIYNFCKHTIIPTGVSSRPRARDEDFGSIGTAMFNALLTATSFLPPPFNQRVATLWLGIDVDNEHFSKVAKIYTVEGFSNPIITNIDVDGITRMGFSFVQLTRPMHNYVNDQITSLNNFSEVMNLMSQWKANGRTRELKYTFSFDRSCILSLHLFPFIVFNEQRAVLGLGNRAGQRETSGTLTVIKSVYNSETDMGHDVMSLKTIETDGVRRIDYAVGEQHSVQAAISAATFHTHPFVMYERTKSIIGPPSSPDLLSYVYTFVALYLTERPSYKFSLISTMEGLHIVSFKPAGIRMMLNHLADAQRRGLTGDAAIQYVVNIMQPITTSYECPDIRKYNWERHYSVNKPKSNEALMTPIENYQAFFIEQDHENGNLFEWQWVDWGNLTTDYEIEVEYLDTRIKV